MLSVIKNYFSITKKEWNGMLFLVAFIVIVLLAPDVYQFLKKPEAADFSKIKEAQKILDQSVKENSAKNINEFSAYNSQYTVFNGTKTEVEYFPFNPNHLPESSWKKLGLSERQIKVIQNYESKGGRFYKKEDLQRIYSVTPEDYARLQPYIEIPERSFNKGFRSQPATYKMKALVVVEINKADSAELTEIKGIGPAFANRILKYRARLGGFYRKTQLMEVYGLDSIKYEEISKQIEINSSEIVKININTCDFEALKRNPYLSFKQMNAIIQYRKQHGNFKSSNDLKNITVLNDETIQKLEPYLSY